MRRPSGSSTAPWAAIIGSLLITGWSHPAAALEPAEAQLSGQLREHLWRPGGVDHLPRADYRLAPDGRLRVEIWTTSAAAARGPAEELRARDIAVEVATTDLLQVLASPEQIWWLAGEPWVRRIDFVTFPEAHATSEGVEMIGADRAHAAGIDGSGLHILIVDGGFRDYQSVLGVELPAQVETYTSSAAGFDDTQSDHGTRCAEILHDVAPGASLTLATAETSAEWVALLEWAALQDEIDIVSMSHGWDDLFPLDGTSALSTALTAVADAGKVVAKSAGNSGDKMIAVPLADGDGNGLADLGPADDRLELWLAADDELDVDLRWDEPFGAAGLDLDLCVLDENYQEVICGGDVQNGNDDPHEAVWQANPTTGVHYVEVRCDPVVGCPAGFALRLTSNDWRNWRNAELGVPLTRAGTITVPGDARRVLTVGAVGFLKYHRSVVTYSSEGPTEDGRTKPEIFAPAHVVTSFDDTGSGFSGTSAAAPHIAGLAALYWQAHPGWTAAEVRQAITDNLDTDIEGRLFGSGLAFWDPAAIDCAAECQGRCGSFRGCSCPGCPAAWTCDRWRRCILDQPEGGPCVLDDFVNQAAGDCRAGLVCLGRSDDQGSCELPYDCNAASWWRNFDCVGGTCFRSYCYVACDAGSCPADYTLEVSTSGDCYCDPSSWRCFADCQGRRCGADACGGSCGDCGADELCTSQGVCACVPNCDTRECGLDPICQQQLCGSCAAGYACEAGSCVCQADCDGRECGEDPRCQESCGSCAAGERCTGGRCTIEAPSAGDPPGGCTCHTTGGVPALPIGCGLGLLIVGRRTRQRWQRAARLPGTPANDPGSV